MKESKPLLIRQVYSSFFKLDEELTLLKERVEKLLEYEQEELREKALELQKLNPVR